MSQHHVVLVFPNILHSMGRTITSSLVLGAIICRLKKILALSFAAILPRYCRDRSRNRCMDAVNCSWASGESSLAFSMDLTSFPFRPMKMTRPSFSPITQLSAVLSCRHPHCHPHCHPHHGPHRHPLATVPPSSPAHFVVHIRPSGTYPFRGCHKVGARISLLPSPTRNYERSPRVYIP